MVYDGLFCVLMCSYVFLCHAACLVVKTATLPLGTFSI